MQPVRDKYILLVSRGNTCASSCVLPLLFLLTVLYLSALLCCSQKCWDNRGKATGSSSCLNKKSWLMSGRSGSYICRSIGLESYIFTTSTKHYLALSKTQLNPPTLHPWDSHSPEIIFWFFKMMVNPTFHIPCEMQFLRVAIRFFNHYCNSYLSRNS